MKIVRVDMQGFGTFASPRSFSFHESELNVVYGGNESGKSTLMEAIYATIFGFEKKETEQNFKSWSPWDSFTGTLELSSPDGTVTFSRDFSSNEVVVTRRANGEPVELFRGEASPRSRSEEKISYANVLRELFGLSDGALARKTSFVGQLDLATEFTPALRGLISGAGSTDYHGAVESLKETFAELTIENPWGAVRRRKRAIEKTADALTEKRQQLREAEALFRDSGKVAEELSELKERMAKLQKAYEESRLFLDKIRRLVELQSKVESNQGLYESEQRARENLERARTACKTEEEQLEKDYPLFIKLGDEVGSAVSSKLSRGGAIEIEFVEVEGELAKERTVLSVSPKPLPYWLIAALSVGIFLAFFIVGILQDRSGAISAAGTAVSVLSAAGLWLFSRGRRRRLSGAKEALEAFQQESSRLKQELKSLSEEVWQLFPEEQRADVRNRTLQQLSTAYAGFMEDRTRLEQLKEKLLSRESSGAREGHADAVKRLAVAESQLEEFLNDEKELLPLSNEPERATKMAAEAEREAKETDSKLKQLAAEFRVAEIKQARLSASTVGSPEAYQEDIEWLEKKLSRLTQRRDALKLGVDTLAQSVEEYQAESMDRISTRISELFRLVTGGRYTTVKLSEDEEPLLETSSWREIGPEQISTGARDQLYFCMRIAMLEELSSQKGLPLILDDPFVNFDDARLERARQLLSDLVSQRKLQIIMFTHGERHLDWDAHIVRLTTSS
ncbi:MAG: hypothetical protein AMJ46_05460 [Latescibacteria bacterium DG_63]|nr:MAG: hypothetical protein AMJ46_05460 [Latescibacteria bacterium DG_63]